MWSSFVDLGGYNYYVHIISCGATIPLHGGNASEADFISDIDIESEESIF